MTMEKYATKPLTQVPACEHFEMRPGVPEKRSDGSSVERTCGTCALYAAVTHTRMPLCPYATRGRPEDPR